MKKIVLFLVTLLVLAFSAVCSAASGKVLAKRPLWQNLLRAAILRLLALF